MTTYNKDREPMVLCEADLRELIVEIIRGEHKTQNFVTDILVDLPNIMQAWKERKHFMIMLRETGCGFFVHGERADHFKIWMEMQGHHAEFLFFEPIGTDGYELTYPDYEEAKKLAREMHEGYLI